MEESGGGIVIQPDYPASLLEHTTGLMHNPTERAAMEEQGRCFTHGEVSGRFAQARLNDVLVRNG